MEEGAKGRKFSALACVQQLDNFWVPSNGCMRPATYDTIGGVLRTEGDRFLYSVSATKIPDPRLLGMFQAFRAALESVFGNAVMASSY